VLDVPEGVGEVPGVASTRLQQLQTVAVAQAVKTRKVFWRVGHALARTTLGAATRRSDKILTKMMTHGTRYFIFMVLFQVFPICYAGSRLDSAGTKSCNQPVGVYLTGVLAISSIRIFVAFFVRRRMDNRNWTGQSFGEALGSIWNMQDEEDQNQTTTDGCVEGVKLNTMIFVVNFFDMLWWFFGFVTMCVNDPAVCAERVTLDGWVLVVWQLFNVFGSSMMLDVGLPYFFLEWDPEVDSVSRSDKKSSGDRKRELKRLAERAQNKALREADRKSKKSSKPRVIKVGPAGGDSASQPEDSAWWMAESGMPPRQRDFSVGSSRGGKVAPAPKALTSDS
jgi:hypothetical protein